MKCDVKLMKVRIKSARVRNGGMNCENEIVKLRFIFCVFDLVSVISSFKLMMGLTGKKKLM